MPQDWRIRNTPRYGFANPRLRSRSDAEAEAAEDRDRTPLSRLGWLASQQRGRVSRVQILALGLSATQTSRWERSGALGRVLPGVYAVGHVAPSLEADLTAAVLYAGPGAALSHGTAAWWLRLSERSPVIIDVTTPRRCQSQPGIRAHSRRVRERIWVRGLPTTSVIDTLLDIAATGDVDEVRYLLAQAEYRRLIDLVEIPARLRSGRPGSEVLRKALHNHMPQLARTRSRLEVSFLLLCEGHGIPLPEVNVRIYGECADAVWRERRVVVELDGGDGHTTRAQMERDRRRDVLLRRHGFIVLRYTWNQVNSDSGAVVDDLRRALAERDARNE